MTRPELAARLIWLDAGSPAPAKPSEPHDGPCYLCGQPSPTGTVLRTRDVFGLRVTMLQTPPGIDRPWTCRGGKR